MICLLIAVAYWFAAIISFALLLGAPKRGRSVSRFLLIGTIVGILLIVTLAFAFGYSFDMIAAVLIYGFLCELFIFLFTLVGTSISVGTLLQLHRGLPYKAAPAVDLRSAVERRLEMMENAGLIRVFESGYQITAKGRTFLIPARRLRRFFRHQ
jgi:ABC-type transport system involved in multi-copper enzyme maturation permease subunit